jgi:hypothetical protein
MTLLMRTHRVSHWSEPEISRGIGYFKEDWSQLLKWVITVAPRSYHATTRTRPRCQRMKLEGTP